MHYGHNSEKITEILERGAIPKYNEANPEKALRVKDVIKSASTLRYDLTVLPLQARSSGTDFGTPFSGSLEECWRIAQDNGTVKLYVERPKVTTAQFEHSSQHGLDLESFYVLCGYFRDKCLVRVES